jgi:hypothetical protein
MMTIPDKKKKKVPNSRRLFLQANKFHFFNLNLGSSLNRNRHCVIDPTDIPLLPGSGDDPCRHAVSDPKLRDPLAQARQCLPHNAPVQHSANGGRETDNDNGRKHWRGQYRRPNLGVSINNARHAKARHGNGFYHKPQSRQKETDQERNRSNYASVYQPGDDGGGHSEKLNIQSGVE